VLVPPVQLRAAIMTMMAGHPFVSYIRFLPGISLVPLWVRRFNGRGETVKFQTNFTSQRAPDLDGFTEIVAQHYEPLYRFAFSLTRAEADACDLTQQTFFVLAAKGYQLRDTSKVKSWLFTTLHRTFLQTRRRHTRFPHHALEEISTEVLPTVSPNFSDKADSAHVMAALAKVDAVYRAAVALFYLEDFSYDEIAKVLDIPLGTVKSRIARGIAELRELLGISIPARAPANVATMVHEEGSHTMTRADWSNPGLITVCSGFIGAEWRIHSYALDHQMPKGAHKPQDSSTALGYCVGGCAPFGVEVAVIESNAAWCACSKPAVHGAGDHKSGRLETTTHELRKIDAKYGKDLPNNSQAVEKQTLAPVGRSRTCDRLGSRRRACSCGLGLCGGR